MGIGGSRFKRFRFRVSDSDLRARNTSTHHIPYMHLKDNPINTLI